MPMTATMAPYTLFILDDDTASPKPTFFVI